MSENSVTARFVLFSEGIDANKAAIAKGNAVNDLKLSSYWAEETRSDGKKNIAVGPISEGDAKVLRWLLDDPVIMEVTTL